MELEPGAAYHAAREAAVFDFVADFLDDRESGATRSLTAYLARFPGHEEAVALEFLRLAGAAAPVDDLGNSSHGGSRGAQSGASAPASDDDPHLIGHYRLVRELGRGGQGAMWLAEDERLGRKVALKLLTTPFITAERRGRFRREVESIARLDHPGLAGVHDADLLAQVTWIAMRFVEGQDLGAALDEARACRRADPIPLCRCSRLYQPTNAVTQSITPASDSKGCDGYSGRYLSVRNSDSEYGLSSLTLGRLNDGTTPSCCRVASIVAPFIARQGRLEELGYLDPGSSAPAFYAELEDLAARGNLAAVCISTATAAIEEAARIAELVRSASPNEPLIVGVGPHEDDVNEPMAARIPWLDLSVAGDAEDALAVLVRYWRRSERWGRPSTSLRA